MNLFSSKKSSKLKKNYSLRKTQKKATSGDPEAQFELGMMYLNDELDFSLEYATEWLGRSGRNGYEPAQIEIAKLCEKGQYFDPNLSLSFRWYEKASSKKNPEALFKLGYYYVEGIGCTKSIDRGLVNLESASELHYADASCYLAEMYRHGVDVPKSYDVMEKWFTAAFQDGMSSVTQKILDIYEDGIKSRDVDAIRHLARIYEEGLFGVAQSFSNALEKYKILADCGDAYGQYRYGLANLLGKGVAKDVKSGLKLLELSANQDNTDAMLVLGNHYLQTTEQDKGVELLKKASRLQRTEADELLGLYYLGKKNPDEALKWVLPPAENGNLKCGYVAAKCFGLKGDLKNYSSWSVFALELFNNQEKTQLVSILENQLNDYKTSADVLWTMIEDDLGYVYKLIQIYETKINDRRKLAECYELTFESGYLVKAGHIYETELGEYSKAIDAYSCAIDRDPSLHDDLAQNIAYIYDRKLNNPKEAVVWYEEVLFEPECAFRAVDLYCEVLNQPSKAANVLRSLGGKANLQRAAFLYYDSEMYEDATDIFTELGDSDSLSMAASIFMNNLNRPKDAAELYEKLDDPESAAACYGEAGDYEKAALLYLDCSDRNPFTRKDYKVKAAEMYEAARDYRQSARIYETCGRDYSIKAAEMYALDKDYRSAAENYRQYSQSHFDDKDTAYLAAEMFERCGDWYEAERLLENLAYNNEIEAMKLLAEHYEHEHDGERKALEWYRMAADRGDWESRDKVRELDPEGQEGY